MEQITEENLQDVFTYHTWDLDQTERGRRVRIALEEAARVILRDVPESPDRSVAIRKLREARMDCNSAITHDGKY